MLSDITSSAIQQYIIDNENTDVNSLLLKGLCVEGVTAKIIVQQIAGRRKAKDKLPFLYKSRNIVYPAKLSMEQCSSELTAIYKSELISGAGLVDLTGGAGIDSYFFSRQFEKVHYVEMDSGLAEICQHNFQQLGATNIRVHSSSAEQYLKDASPAIKTAYIDPARRDANKNKVFKFSDCKPDVTQLLPELMSKFETIMVKASPMIDISQGLMELTNVEHVHVVAVNNDCKEVLYLVNKDYQGDVSATCANHSYLQGWQHFNFKLKDEALIKSPFSLPQKFLYEPNVSILKAGAFKLIGNKYGLDKLESNSHLYTSSQLFTDFPGRVFEIKSTLPYSKKILKNAVPSGKANITVRNFNDSVESIRKKTGLKPGGEDYLFATTLMDAKKVIILTKKVE